MVNGSPISEYNYLPPPVSIMQNIQFEEASAVFASGIDLQYYETLPGTPMWIVPGEHLYSKCHIIMWHRLEGAIPNVGNDANARKQLRDLNRAKARGRH